MELMRHRQRGREVMVREEKMRGWESIGSVFEKKIEEETDKEMIEKRI